MQVTGPATRSLNFVGTDKTGKVQRNIVGSKAGCDVMRYKQKERPLTVNLQLQGKQCTGPHKLSHKFYINGCASPVTPINTFSMINSAEYRAFVMAGPNKAEQWRADGVVGR